MSKPVAKQPQRNLKIVIACWVATLISAALLYVAATAFVSDIGTFRPCSTNTSGLSISSCGKQGLNLGDFVLLAIFLAAAALLVSLFTAATRVTRRAN